MRKLIFALARWPLAATLVRWMFAHMSMMIPVERLYEDELVMAFHHPQPSYAVHVLLVPKRAIAGLAALGDADGDVLLAVYAAVQRLVGELGLAERGYRLVCNGGQFQDVGQLHFHLVGGGEDAREA